MCVTRKNTIHRSMVNLKVTLKVTIAELQLELRIDNC